MEKRIKLEGGKYEIIMDLARGIYRADRHGEPWRNLIGDKLILALISRLEDAEGLLQEAQDTLDNMHGYNEQVYADINQHFKENE